MFDISGNLIKREYKKVYEVYHTKFIYETNMWETLVTYENSEGGLYYHIFLNRNFTETKVIKIGYVFPLNKYILSHSTVF